MMKRHNRTQRIRIPIKSVEERHETAIRDSSLKIGEVAKISGIPIVTLRFYENEGMIQSFAAEKRRKSKHRRFSSTVFLHLELIKVCRSAGISIPQIKSLMKLYRDYKLPSRVNMSALRRSIDLIRDQKKKLSRIEKALLHRLNHPEDDLDDLFEKNPELF